MEKNRILADVRKMLTDKMKKRDYIMTRKIVIDIETLPCADQQQIDYPIESVTADSRLKRSRKKLQQTLHRSAQRLLQKQGDGGSGRILMASAGVIWQRRYYNVCKAQRLTSVMFCADCLREIYHELSTKTQQRHFRRYLSATMFLWDLVFIAQRCAINGFTINKRTTV